MFLLHFYGDSYLLILIHIVLLERFIYTLKICIGLIMGEGQFLDHIFLFFEKFVVVYLIFFLL